ncbi:hypothetical protein [Chitinophaga nivalis]|uniref:DUF4625 domain-containing protein n=1 Tax=Chitinophaga nivalis TaxID=2991709 RepID=A0ABT3IR40_9BACT|nr:hypothetical protein [Chitinophaga nivalis]MCW3463885.1 hypothetical protein [Chitinophaga nivalis]MCW3486425.1 hypothetical protein [Chitinophaga nivalis]
MKKILFLFLVAGFFYACKKDGVGPKPIVTFKSYSVDSITPATNDMTIFLNVEDGDGDIEDTLTLGTIILSHFKDGKIDTAWTPKSMPEIGRSKGLNVKAEVRIPLQTIEIKFSDYVTIPKDSINFSIIIKDRAGNISDTLITPKISYRA